MEHPDEESTRAETPLWRWEKNEGNKVEKRVVGKVHGGVFAVVNTCFWREAMRVVIKGHVAVYVCSH